MSFQLQAARPSLFIVAILALSLHTVPSFAAYPLVICGGNAGSSAVELDGINVARGGSSYNQLVLRNSEIIEDFVKKQAIYRGELNSKGEFIVSGWGDSNSGSPKNSLSAALNNRHVRFTQNTNSTYTLTVTYTDSNFRAVTLADFTFNDCRTTE
jgi:hypothetical protein